MTLCRGALGLSDLSDTTWYIRLPPVSEDKGQYSMPRGGQDQEGLPAYRYPDRCAFRDHLGSLPVLRHTRGVGWHSTARSDPWWTDRNWGEPSTALALPVRSHTHGQPKWATPFKAPAALFRPYVVPINEVMLLWDPSAIRRSDSGKVLLGS
ncbi:hypothetical protein EDB89DRAFT_1965943 [Lactarius sanguifluus]|nr:hypothetical protein EDB89DRAFT_1965943 [Lactarius sanguifluus]